MAIHYVASDGTDAWANSTNIATPCSLATANTNADVGDMVYLRAGTYTVTGSAIDPAHSGTAGNLITYSSYNDEDVQLVGSGLSSFAIDLNSDSGTVRSYIKVHDLHFTNFMSHLWILKGRNNEISHVTCVGHPAEATDAQIQGNWSASYIYRQAKYNWIHDCVFGLWGGADDYGHDYGVVFQCGLETSSTDDTKYNLVEDCEFYSGGHHVISFNGSYNVYRRIYAHNEPWSPIGAPVFATRTMFQTGANGDGIYNLVDQCRIGYGGPKNKDEIGGAGGTIASQYNIWRRNVFLQIYTMGMYVTKYSGQNNVIHNHVYNNTFWHGGYGEYQKSPGGTAPSANWDNRYTHAILVEEDEDCRDNAFKNNIFYQNNDLLGTQYSLLTRYYDSELGWITKVPELQELENNWLDSDGDPKFVDITGTPDPTDADQFDFHLQDDSPCIDAGEFLTTITSESGSGTTFTVEDAGYFFIPKGGMEDEISEAILVGDTIQLEGQTETAVITDIDYATNEITIDTSLTWTQNTGVALAYTGSHPDIGAYEGTSEAPPEPPAGDKVIMILK